MDRGHSHSPSRKAQGTLLALVWPVAGVCAKMSPDMLWPRKSSGTKLEASQRGGNGAWNECECEGTRSMCRDLDDCDWGYVDVRDTCDHLPSWQGNESA